MLLGMGAPAELDQHLQSIHPRCPTKASYHTHLETLHHRSPPVRDWILRLHAQGDDRVGTTGLPTFTAVLCLEPDQQCRFVKKFLG